MKNLFLKNVLKLTFVYVLWSLFYAVDTLGMVNLVTNLNLRELASLAIHSKYHLWYLPELISVYLMLPVLFALKKYENGKMLTYICGMVFLFTIVRASILVFVDSTLLKNVLDKIHFGLGSCCGCFVLGCVLDQNKEKLRKIKTPILLLCFAALVAVTTIGVYWDSAAKGTASSELYNDIFITNFLAAATLFVLFLRIPTGNPSVRMTAWMQKLSKYTLFVYLVHPFLLEHLKSIFSIDTLSFNPWLSVPTIAAIVFLTAMFAAYVIDRLPGVRKILL